MSILGFGGTTLALVLGGLALLLGFGADYLAERFRIPDALWLIVFGVLVGPVFGLVARSEILIVAPIVGTAVLAIILFDAGLDMRAQLIRPFLGSTVAFAVGTFAVSATALFVSGYWFIFPGHVALSLYFAASLGATSGAIAIPVANRMGLPAPLRGFIHLEAALEDTLAIVSAGFILLVVTPGGSLSSLDLVLALTLPVPVGIAVGGIAAIGWLFVFSRWQDRRYAALATLGYVLVVYGVAVLFGGSGIFATLILGIVIANSYALRRISSWIRAFEMRQNVRAVQTEVSFLLRALFLFFLGILVVLANPGVVSLIAFAILSFAMVGFRFVVARALGAAHRLPSPWVATLGGLGGRGLTTAVLLVLPLGIIPGAAGLFLPGVVIIVGTNIVMTIWLAGLGRSVPTSGAETGSALYAPVAAQLPLLERLALEDTEERGPSLLPAKKISVEGDDPSAPPR